MRIEDQVVSLELAKRLKELRVKQDSLFYWSGIITSNLRLLFPKEKTDILLAEDGWSEQDIASAFTVAELGELLPNEIANTELFTPMIQKRMKHHKNRWSWHLNYYGGVEKTFLFDEFVIDDTEANARAKMLIHLIESGIIDPKEAGWKK